MHTKRESSVSGCVRLRVLQPVKRLRSVSMPGENPQMCIAALETSNNYLRPPMERLPSFTQSIKRLDTHTVFLPLW